MQFIDISTTHKVTILMNSTLKMHEYYHNLKKYMLESIIFNLRVLNITHCTSRVVCIICLVKVIKEIAASGGSSVLLFLLCNYYATATYPIFTG